MSPYLFSKLVKLFASEIERSLKTKRLISQQTIHRLKLKKTDSNKKTGTSDLLDFEVNLAIRNLRLSMSFLISRTSIQRRSKVSKTAQIFLTIVMEDRSQ